MANIFGSGILLMCILVLTSGQDSRGEQFERRDDGSLLSVHQIPHPQDTRGRDSESSSGRSRSVFSREAMRERLDSIILLISRISDRMVAMEAQKQQQNERIDNINYRITKLDLGMTETKSQFSEVWMTLRHRLETADRELGHTNELLDAMKADMAEINTKSTQLSNKIESIRRMEDRNGNGGQTPKLQSVLTAVFGVRGSLQQLHLDLASIDRNFTTLANDTRKFAERTGRQATKEDLHLGFVGVREDMEDYSRTFISPHRERKNKKESVDCWELLHKKGKAKSGVYRIHPSAAARPFFVYCDMETDGGGWTVIQRREDGIENFQRGWKDYKFGFGNLAGEFWMGNEKLFLMTNEHVNELRVELADFSQTVVTASYKAFGIGPESEGYAIRLLSAYGGDAGDSLRYHVGQKWSTYDMDNDAWPDKNCAREHTGAWWYRACDTSNLNGMYHQGGPVPPGDEYKGIYWYDFHGPQYSLWRSTMMIRRGGYTVRMNATMADHVKHGPNIPHPLEDAHGENFNPDEEPLFIFNN